jgi:radical SAM superfamily enzyme YgiQ (UPF0313 family)
LADPRHAVVDKTIAGGLGTATDYGDGLVGGLLLKVKAGAIRLLNYHVAYVAAQLRAQGHQPTLYRRLPALGECDVAVLFTSIPSLRVDRDALAALSVPTIVVGTLAGVAPEEYGDATLIVRGEPEAFFQDDGVRSAMNPGAQLVEAGFVQDLDRLPSPDWSIFPRLDSRYWIVRARGKVLPVVTSRGCPYPCGHYCPYPLEEGTAMRYRSTGSVVDELNGLRDRHGVTAVKFRDPILTINRDRALALCEAVGSSGTIWGCETHLDTLDEELLERMARAGCVLIQTGVESTAADVLRANRRRTATPEHTRAMLQAAERLGIRVAIYFMLGLPGDSLAGMRRSLVAAPSLPASFLQITVATPYPGTPLWEENKDRLRTTDLANFDQYSSIVDGDWTNDDLRSLMGEAYRRFYLRPGRLAHEVRIARGRRSIRR